VFRWINKRRFRLKSAVYIRHETRLGYTRHNGTVAGYGSWSRVLVRIDDGSLRLFPSTELTVVVDNDMSLV
jgi:hypothetical protein